MDTNKIAYYMDNDDDGDADILSMILESQSFAPINENVLSKVKQWWTSLGSPDQNKIKGNEEIQQIIVDIANRANEGDEQEALRELDKLKTFISSRSSVNKYKSIISKNPAIVKYITKNGWDIDDIAEVYQNSLTIYDNPEDIRNDFKRYDGLRKNLDNFYQYLESELVKNTNIKPNMKLLKALYNIRKASEPNKEK